MVEVMKMALVAAKVVVGLRVDVALRTWLA